MEVLGRYLIEPFDRFWSEYGTGLEIEPELIRQAHSTIFGELGADKTAPESPAWTKLRPDNLSYHVAHELGHHILRRQGYPIPLYGGQNPAGQDELRIIGDLQELVDHAAIRVILTPFGFNNDLILDRTANGATQGLARSPVPKTNTTWFATWAIRYAELSSELDIIRLEPIQNLYQERAPAAAEIGNRLIRIIDKNGCHSSSTALKTMVEARNELGLGNWEIIVQDPITNQIY